MRIGCCTRIPNPNNAFSLLHFTASFADYFSLKVLPLMQNLTLKLAPLTTFIPKKSNFPAWSDLSECLIRPFQPNLLAIRTAYWVSSYEKLAGQRMSMLIKISLRVKTRQCAKCDSSCYRTIVCCNCVLPGLGGGGSRIGVLIRWTLMFWLDSDHLHCSHIRYAVLALNVALIKSQTFGVRLPAWARGLGLSMLLLHTIWPSIKAQNPVRIFSQIMFVILGCWGIWAACTCQLWSPFQDGILSWSKSLFSLVQFHSEDIRVIHYSLKSCLCNKTSHLWTSWFTVFFFINIHVHEHM